MQSSLLSDKFLIFDTQVCVPSSARCTHAQHASVYTHTDTRKRKRKRTLEFRCVV